MNLEVFSTQMVTKAIGVLDAQAGKHHSKELCPFFFGAYVPVKEMCNKV